MSGGDFHLKVDLKSFKLQTVFESHSLLWRAVQKLLWLHMCHSIHMHTGFIGACEDGTHLTVSLRRSAAAFPVSLTPSRPAV